MANKPARYVPGSRGEGFHYLAQHHEIYRIRRYPVSPEKMRAIKSLLLIATLVGGMVWVGYAHRRQNTLDAALYDAVKWNNPEKVRILLTQGADPNLKWRNDPSLGLWDFYKPLVGTDPRRSDSGRTPLMVASAEGKTAIAQALLAAHADVAMRDGQGHTALYWAQQGRGKEGRAILRLLQQKAPSGEAAHLAERNTSTQHTRE